MGRRRRGRRDPKLKPIQFPIAVRQAQRLVDKGGYALEALVDALGHWDWWHWDTQDLRAALARLAAQKGPNYLIKEDPSSESPYHGGDGNSGEVDNPAATVSPEAGGPAAAANGEQGSPRESSPPLENSCPETGGPGVPTPGMDPSGESPELPAHGVTESPSTALGDEGVPVDNTSTPFGLNPPRDADEAETQAPSTSEAKAGDTPADAEVVAGGDGDPEEGTPNNLGGDRPTHRKKWGKSFKSAASENSRRPKSEHGGITADLRRIGVDPALFRLARRRLAELVGDTAQDYGPRYDWAEFCARLATYRSPQRARKEEIGRPILWVMADVSASCSSFSVPALQVAKACSKLGIPGTDIVVVSHSNGYPEQWEANGKDICIPLPDPLDWGWEEYVEKWWDALSRHYPPQIVVAIGDWDAADLYARLGTWPAVERLLWLDNYCCSRRGPRDSTAKVVQHYPRLRGRVRYVDGCKDAAEFIEQIR